MHLDCMAIVKGAAPQLPSTRAYMPVAASTAVTVTDWLPLLRNVVAIGGMVELTR